MKKYISILFMSIALSFSGNLNAQSFSGTTTNPTGAILNATSDTLGLTMSGTYNAVMTVQVLATRSSGTMAGTVRIYGSNFGTLAVPVTGTWQPASDTLTLTNAATNMKVWTLTQPAYRYYYIVQSGGTTVAGILAAKAVGIKPN